FLVWEHLGVGKPAVVVDADVHALIADAVAADAVTVCAPRAVLLAALAVKRAFAGAALDPGEPFDVDVDELARPGVLVADRLLEPEPAEPSQADPGQDPRDGRERHPERLRDLCCGEAQPAKLDDHLDPVGRCAVGDPLRRRRAIQQPSLSLQTVASNPLTRTPHADPGGLGRRGQRPTINNP